MEINERGALVMFGNGKTKEEKQDEQLQKFTEKYHIDDLDPKDLEIVKNIANDLFGTSVQKGAMAFSGKPEEYTKVTYLSALIEQNWLIINQLNRLNKNMENLSSK